jgi:hypothetical protein
MTGLSACMPDDRIVRASDVSAQIRADEAADFDNCIIEGNLDLSGLKIADEVHFNNTRFEGFVYFNSTIVFNLMPLYAESHAIRLSMVVISVIR